MQLISASPEHADTLAADDSDVLTTAPDLSSQARVRNMELQSYKRGSRDKEQTS